MRRPSIAARLGLAIGNLAGAAACGFAASHSEALPVDASPLAIVFWCVAGACVIVGVPGAVVDHPGVRSLSRALAAVGIAAGGAASVVALAVRGTMHP